MVKNLPANSGETGSIPGSARSAGEGNGNPLHYSCLENPITEETVRLQFMGLQRVSTNEHACTILIGSFKFYNKTEKILRE